MDDDIDRRQWSLTRRFVWLVLRAHTAPARTMIGVASIMWAILLFWPGYTFVRQPYAVMAQFGSESAWGCLFALHGISVLWLLIDRIPRFMIAMVVNVLGTILFCGAALCLALAVSYPLPAALAADVSLAGAAVWTLMRTALNSDQPEQR